MWHISDFIWPKKPIQSYTHGLMLLLYYTRNKVIKSCNQRISVMMNLKCYNVICSDMLSRLNMNLWYSMVGCWKIDRSFCCLHLIGCLFFYIYEAMIAVFAASTCIIEFNVACMPIAACTILSSMMMVVFCQSSLKKSGCLSMKDDLKIVVKIILFKLQY